MPATDPDPDIIVSTNGFVPPEFNAGGPGTAVTFQAAGRQRVAFYAQEGLFYICGKRGETNESRTPFYAPAAPETLKLYVVAASPAAYGLCNSSPCTETTGKINVGMRVSSSGFSPISSDVDAGASVVFQSQGSEPVTFTADQGLFDTDGPTTDSAPVVPEVRRLYVLGSASRILPYKLRVSGDPGGTGDGQINVGSGPGDGDGDGDRDDD
jgi:hypothetical protein